MSQEKYKIILADDRGKTLRHLDSWAYVNYSRVVNGVGTMRIGLPFAKFGDLYRPDYQIQVWRAPKVGDKRRLENIFFLRKSTIRTRIGDGVTIQQLDGEDPNGLLDSRVEKFKAGSPQATKTGSIDDMMKNIVDDQMGAVAFADDSDRGKPFDEGFFSIQGDTSYGATITKSFSYRNVASILRDLAEMSKTNTPKIFYDVVPLTPKLFEFQTFRNQRGPDQRFSSGQTAFFFSLERGNLKGPILENDNFNEKSVIYAGGQGTGAARVVEERENTTLSEASLWARREAFRDARGESTVAGVQAAGDEELGYRKPKLRFIADFLSIPGSQYGIDWDFGGQYTVDYAGRLIDIEMKIVYVSINEDGAESIFGRNEFGEFEQS